MTSKYVKTLKRAHLWGTQKELMATTNLRGSLRLWIWRSTSLEQVSKSIRLTSFKPKTSTLPMAVQRPTIETEQIKIKQKTLEVSTILQDSQWIAPSFPKLLKACWVVQLQLKTRTRRRRPVCRADKEETLLRAREQARRKEIQFLLLKNQSFHQKTSFSSQRSFLMEEIMHSKLQICSLEKQHRQRSTLEMQTMGWQGEWVDSPWMGYQTS